MLEKEGRVFEQHEIHRIEARGRRVVLTIYDGGKRSTVKPQRRAIRKARPTRALALRSSSGKTSNVVTSGSTSSASAKGGKD